MNSNLLSNILLGLLIVWSIFWNGLALWISAREGQRNWFVVMLILKTAGILEIAYLFFFAKKRLDYHSFFFWKK